MERREFLKKSALAALGTTIAGTDETGNRPLLCHQRTDKGRT